MRYYGLSEVDLEKPESDVMVFYNLVLLLGTVAVLLLLLGIGYNYFLGIVGFICVSLVLIFVFIMRERKIRAMDDALSGIPRVTYFSARAFAPAAAGNGRMKRGGQ